MKDDIFNTKDFNKRLKNFLEEWDHIKSVSIKYKYRDYMPIKKSFTKKNKLLYLNILIYHLLFAYFNFFNYRDYHSYQQKYFIIKF